MNKEHTSALTSQITFALAILASAAVALVVGFAWFAAVKTDEAALERQKNFVRHGLAEQISALPREQESITIWDDAVTFARAGDQQWLAENLGEWMNSYFGHDRAYVLDEQGRLIYAMRDGATIVPPRFAEAYQPLYARGGRRVTGAEALLRWEHPVHGTLAPNFLVGIAEECGLMPSLGDWVLREAAGWLRPSMFPGSPSMSRRHSCATRASRDARLQSSPAMASSRAGSRSRSPRRC